jgi:hypothetical protein
LDINILSRATAEFGDGRQTVLVLMEGWAIRVLRLFEEHGLSNIDEVRDTRGIHDFIAALHIRDYLEAGLRTNLRDERDPALVRVTDQLFMSFTLEDTSWTWVQPDLPSEPWWWHRFPVSGPVALELDELSR